MITKSGVLQFLKLCVSRLTRHNDISLAIPALLLNVFKGFMDSPTAWDGSIPRKVWVQQFLDMAQVMLASVPDLQRSSIEWEYTYVSRVVEYTKSVLEVASTLHCDATMVGTNLLAQAASWLENAITPDGIVVAQDPYDVDALYQTHYFEPKRFQEQ